MGEDIKAKAAADIAKNMPAEEYLYDLADLFRIFGDTTRIRILYLTESFVLVIFQQYLE